MKYLLIFILVMALEFLLIPLFINAAVRIGFVDQPTERKKHESPMPLSGGVAMFIAFSIGYAVFLGHLNDKCILTAIAAVMVLLIGLVDDWYKSRSRDFSAGIRLLVHLAAALIIFYSGTVFRGFTNPLTHGYVALPVGLQLLFTVTWIVGVTTVINWSDGLDGLAGGISAISGSTLFVVAIAKDRNYSAVMSLILVAAALGFLKYNRHPAKIFMGDSGANFLGFMLGVIALDGALKQATIVSIFIPILALGVPIMDNLFVVFKRLAAGKPIYEADRSQIHYRLLGNGFNHRQTTNVILLISACLSLVSIVLLFLRV